MWQMTKHIDECASFTTNGCIQYHYLVELLNFFAHKNDFKFKINWKIEFFQFIFSENLKRKLFSCKIECGFYAICVCFCIHLVKAAIDWQFAHCFTIPSLFRVECVRVCLEMTQHVEWYCTNKITYRKRKKKKADQIRLSFNTCAPLRLCECVLLFSFCFIYFIFCYFSFRDKKKKTIRQQMFWVCDVVLVCDGRANTINEEISCVLFFSIFYKR